MKKKQKQKLNLNIGVKVEYKTHEYTDKELEEMAKSKQIESIKIKKET